MRELSGNEYMDKLNAIHEQENKENEHLARLARLEKEELKNRQKYQERKLSNSLKMK